MLFSSDVSTSTIPTLEVTVEQATHEQMEMLGPLKHAEVENDAVKDLVMMMTRTRTRTMMMMMMMMMMMCLGLIVITVIYDNI